MVERIGDAHASAQVERLLAYALPETEVELAQFGTGVAWIGADLSASGIVVYVAPDPDPILAWDRAQRTCEALLARPEASLALLAKLRGIGQLASIALEVGRNGGGVFKVYWRLQRAISLAEIGPLWAHQEFAILLRELVGNRPMNFSGLVLSQGFELDGEPAGTKLDLCAHCIDRPVERWVDTLARLERAFSLRSCGVEGSLRSGAAGMAFVGLGRKANGQVRLNVYLRPPRLEPAGWEARANAVRRAAAHLLDTQQPDGHWSDYRLPVGTSTQWVTAYAGLALTFAHQVFEMPSAGRGAIRAAQWLKRSRNGPGWGFNDRTGADADSTGLAIRLLARLGDHIEDCDLDFLTSHWRAEGGFATYLRADAWGHSHPCVTGQAFKALPLALRREQGAALEAYLTRARLPNGHWPSYWWTRPEYATYQCLSTLQQLGKEVPAPELSDRERDLPGFDLAHAWGIAALCGATEEAARLLDSLLVKQQPDGRWHGGACLRVTDPSCSQPWIQPAGEVYTDHHGILTTAATMVALGEAAEFAFNALDLR